jgi:hypothetical protein
MFKNTRHNLFYAAIPFSISTKCYTNVTSLTILFADDTSFNCSHSDGTEIQSIINHDLKELDEWSKRWLMTFNPDKTEIMLFTNLEHSEINPLGAIFLTAPP